MIISLVKNKFCITFSQDINLLMRKGICSIFKVKLENTVFVDTWLFLNKMKTLNEYLKINKLVDKLYIDDDATQLILDISKKYKVNLNSSINLSEVEIQNILKKLGLKRELKLSQLQNVEKLLKSSVGADFSVPGAGKSTTAFSLYCIRKCFDSDLKMLIICPKNVFGAWEDENRVCFQNPMKLCRLEGGIDKIRIQLTKNYDVFLITYEQLLTSGECIERFLIKNKTSIYIDECHRMKNGFRGKIGSKILNLAHLPKYKNIMSGTPMPNKLTDLVSLYEFLYPLENVNEKSVVDKIQGVYVRTTKFDMKLKPYKIIRSIVPKDKEFEKLYNLCMGRELSILLNNMSYIEMINNIRRYVIKMIQLTSNPALLLKATPELQSIKEFSNIVNKKIPPKIRVAVERARQLASEGKKVIIWTNFIDNIKYLEYLFKDLNPISIFGETPVGSVDNPLTREGKLKRFKEIKDDCFIMIANPQAVSEGISLQNICSYSIFIDRNYDSRLFEQAINRIHRLGLFEGNQVIIEVLLLEHTIDMNIDRALERKMKNMHEVLNDNNLQIEYEQFVNEENNLDNFEIGSGMNEDDIKELIYSLF